MQHQKHNCLMGNYIAVSKNYVHIKYSFTVGQTDNIHKQGQFWVERVVVGPVRGSCL